jgi:hypothetical protein
VPHAGYSTKSCGAVSHVAAPRLLQGTAVARAPRWATPTRDLARCPRCSEGRAAVPHTPGPTPPRGGPRALKAKKGQLGRTPRSGPNCVLGRFELT